MTARATAVGAVSWIAAEKENALHLLQNEKEEVIYPAQHQLEWLNEHMAEIFSKSHLYVKLRKCVFTGRLTRTVMSPMFSRLRARCEGRLPALEGNAMPQMHEL
jgi:hypothetical protein